MANLPGVSATSHINAVNNTKLYMIRCANASVFCRKLYFFLNLCAFYFTIGNPQRGRGVSKERQRSPLPANFHRSSNQKKFAANSDRRNTPPPLPPNAQSAYKISPSSLANYGIKRFILQHKKAGSAEAPPALYMFCLLQTK